MFVKETDKVIISELLFYIQNRVKCVSKDILVALCAKNFTADEIKQEKTKFFDSINVRTTERKKGSEQLSRNLHDIIDKMIELDNNNTDIPVFVARDMTKLPKSDENAGDNRASFEVLINSVQDLSDSLKEVQSQMVTQKRFNDFIDVLPSMWLRNGASLSSPRRQLPPAKTQNALQIPPQSPSTLRLPSPPPSSFPASMASMSAARPFIPGSMASLSPTAPSIPSLLVTAPHLPPSAAAPPIPFSQVELTSNVATASSNVAAASSNVAVASSNMAAASSRVAVASSNVAAAASNVAPASSTVAPASSNVAPASSNVASTPIAATLSNVAVTSTAAAPSSITGAVASSISESLVPSPRTDDGFARVARREKRPHPNAQGRKTQRDQRSQSRPRRQNNLVVGKKVVDGLVSCRGADLTMSVYLGQFDVSCTYDAVKTSIESQGVGVVELEELKLSHQRFKSFRLCLRKNDMPRILDPEFWPAGVVVRRFWRGKQAQTHSVPS